MVRNLIRILLVISLLAGLAGCGSVAQKEQEPPKKNYQGIFKDSLAAMKELKSYRLLAHTTSQENDKFKALKDEEFDFVAPDKTRLHEAGKDTFISEEIQIGSTAYVKKSEDKTWNKIDRPEGIKYTISLESMEEDFKNAHDISILMDGDYEGVDCLALSFKVAPEVYPEVETKVNYFFEKQTNRVIRIERINEKNGRSDYTETFYRFVEFDVAPDILPPQ